MRRVIWTICLMAILLVMGCQSEQEKPSRFRAWLGGNEATTFRGGYLVDPNTEVGGEFVCWNDDLKTVSVYALRHSSDSVVKFANPFVLFGGPETLEGYGYFGGKIYKDIDLGTSGFSPIGGILSRPFYIEGQLNSAEPSTLVLGLFHDF